MGLVKLAFVTGSPYLVGCSNRFVAVWNLLTASLQWVLDVPTSALATDPTHATFAIAVPAPSFLKGGAAAASAAAAAVAAPHHDQPSGRAVAEGVQAGGACDGMSEGAAAAGTGDAQLETGPSSAGGTSSRGRSDPGGSRQTSSQKWQPPQVHNSHVLVFDPRSPSPRYHCLCPGTLAPTLLYVPPGMPQHPLESKRNIGGISPLMVLTESRAYTYISRQGKGIEHACRII